MWVLHRRRTGLPRVPPNEGAYSDSLLEGFVGELLLVVRRSEFVALVRSQDIQRSGGWPHLRSYFFNALPENPGEAIQAQGTLRDLVMLERPLTGMPDDEVLATSLAHAMPLVDGFFMWVTPLSSDM